MSTYRILDEIETGTRRPPWSPLGLFFLTVLFLPVAVPFWTINWARLGQPKRRWITLGAGVLGSILPILLAILVVRFGWESDAGRIVYGIFRGGYAFGLLFAQRPLYELYLQNGGIKAPAWPLWLAALAGVAFSVVRAL